MKEKIQEYYKHLFLDKNMGIPEMMDRIDIIAKYLERYNMCLIPPVYDEDEYCYVAGLLWLDLVNNDKDTTLLDSIRGYIYIDEDYISIHIDKYYCDNNLCIYEYINVYEDTFEGNYCDLVVDNSGIKYSVNNEPIKRYGKINCTYFSSSEIMYDDNTSIPYYCDNNIDKLDESYNFHKLGEEEIIESFIYDNLNIYSVNVFTEEYMKISDKTLYNSPFEKKKTLHEDKLRWYNRRRKNN